MGIGGGGPVLPADLQLAGIAMRDLKISSAPALQKLGGPSELEEAWLMEACRATGNERSALRLCLSSSTTSTRPAPATCDPQDQPGSALRIKPSVCSSSAA